MTAVFHQHAPVTHGASYVNAAHRRGYLNGSDCGLSRTNAPAADGHRIEQDLTLEKIVLGGILANGLSPLEDADISLGCEDFSNPDYGKILQWLRSNRDRWRHGYANLTDIHNQLDKADLVSRLGQGSAAVVDLLGAGGEIGPEVLRHRVLQLIEASIERQRRGLAQDYLRGRITHDEQARRSADLTTRLSRGIRHQELPPFLSLREMAETFVVDPPLIIAGPDTDNERDGAVLALGELGVLASTSKLGKTWTVIDSALAVASGTPWMGHFNCHRGRVLYCNMELSGQAFVRRVEMLMDKRGLKAADVVENIRVWQLRNRRVAAVEELGQRIAASGERFDLIILDPLYRLLGDREENSNGDMGELMSAIREKFCNGDQTAVLLVHHFPKGDPSKRASLDRLAGAGAIARDADALITITPDAETYRLEYTTRDYKAGSALELKMNFPAIDVVGVAEAISPKAKAQANNNLLREMVRDRSNMTKADLVAAYMEETGACKSMAYKSIKAAEKARAIERTKLEKTYVAL